MQSESISIETEAGTVEPPPTTDAQAQKRVAIGLSPRRPTARAVVQRPPRSRLAQWQQWSVIALVLLLMLTTGLLIVAKSTGAATSWTQVRAQIGAWIGGEGTMATPMLSAPSPDYQLRAEDTFTTLSSLLAADQQAGQWTTAPVPDRGVYRFQLWPGRLAWSTLAVEDLTTYWIDASFTIADLKPEGYTGFLARYQDASNFYLFVVNGTAHYEVLLWQAGTLTTLQPWRSSPVLNPAGYENLLALEDDGQALRFYANEQLLFTVDSPVLPFGATGLAGGAGERTMAEITVDWLRLYEPIP
ncbi:MAG: hypothetical protein KF832_10570 [Caldilineaceae bacterium]|nr:hypothetical protein [Caldilineaceae bacterium]